ncbi:MAG: hypothetical protein GY854_15760, partial [Deltaproteobacteria bacterium]|nr:hypothetical protein [Deltaproteobacteria bacterium]
MAISNHRLIEIENGRVTFSYRDYKNDVETTMTLTAVEFLRRFLLHVLPGGFTRIRHYGLYTERGSKRQNEVFMWGDQMFDRGSTVSSGTQKGTLSYL